MYLCIFICLRVWIISTQHIYVKCHILPKSESRTVGYVLIYIIDKNTYTCKLNSLINGEKSEKMSALIIAFICLLFCVLSTRLVGFVCVLVYAILVNNFYKYICQHHSISLNYSRIPLMTLDSWIGDINLLQTPNCWLIFNGSYIIL